MGGRDRDRGGDFGPDKTDCDDWRAPRPSGGESDDGPPRRDDAFGDREYSIGQKPHVLYVG